MPKIVYRRVDRRKPESTYLKKYARNVMSQGGEDGIVEQLLKVLGSHAESKWCVEFGAWDGKHYSNTWNLINHHGYNAVMIEGSRTRFQDLLATYGAAPQVVCVNRIVSFAQGPDSLDSIFAETRLPRVFDLISIDIDGNDYHVWDSLKSYAPRIVVIEFNSTIPNDVVFVQDMNFKVNQGCSLLALIELGQTKGYELAYVTHLNAIFVRADEFSKLGIADNGIDAMYMPFIEPKMFQAFDGTLFNVGMDRLQWTLKKTKVKSTQFQLLPAAKRWFPGSITDIQEREASGAPVPVAVPPKTPTR
ncbi:hypothetical protein [Methylibium petroleiphilum]|uniref:hypothetical protein n=1 Tax=Methylibium petroleiphilum TaxID=105560 RepID=UPI001AD3735D|nr:hypothetical protein [Methylibium petroleiphilum]MBN9204240.1 hypothetical protein [Methylibium petroleiphilum]